MSAPTTTVDLKALRLTSGEGRRMDLTVHLDSFELSDETYSVEPEEPEVRLDISRTTGPGYALHLRFSASLAGPCMRCLEPASAVFMVDALEVSQPGAGEDLESPYVEGEVLDLEAWAHDALALMLPAAIMCKPGCAGLCPICGADLNTAGRDHHHEPEPDPRWAKLSELKLD